MSGIPPVGPIPPFNPLDPTLDVQHGHGGGRKRPPRIDQPNDRPAPLQPKRPPRSPTLEALDRIGQRGDEQCHRRRRQQPGPEADEPESTSKGHVIDFEV